jgi:hypothetical protein
MRQGWLKSLIFGLFCLWPALGWAAGTIPLAMMQQVDINGKPLAGCILYFFQAGTVGTPQNSYSDFGLSLGAASQVNCDQTGRLPMFWLADGLIQFRLTDAGGVVVISGTMQVLGPSSGGGGGGGTVDPTTIAATGDIKFRMTSETVAGWVKLNGTTIGNATSGASGRANADTQNLFVYLWTNCTNNHCPVSGGRGGSALADYNASKTLTLPSWQDKSPHGRDCMEGTCAGVLLSANISSGGGDGVDTPAAFGGGANTLITQTYLPNVAVPLTGTSPGVSFTQWNGTGGTFASGGGTVFNPVRTSDLVNTALPAPQGTTTLGSGVAYPNIGPFVLGSWYVKL